MHPGDPLHAPPTPAAPQPPRLLDRLRDALRARQVSDATAAQYVHWTTRYILFHGKRHPQELTEDHVQRFLAHLAAAPGAVDWPAAARQALVFLYREVLQRPLKELLLRPVAGPATRAHRPRPPAHQGVAHPAPDIPQVHDF
jgi:hypothetical protein